MEGWIKFKNLFFPIIKDKFITELTYNKKKIINFILENNENINHVITKDNNHTREDDFLIKIYECFMEILLSVSTLKDIEIYINSFPFTNRKLNKIRFLRYNIENYFNEVYLLKERLLSFLRILQKEYRKDKEYNAIINKLYPLIKTLSPLTNARGEHIHKNRLIDIHLLRLELFEGLIISPPIETEHKNNNIIQYYNLVYNETKKKWKKQILKFNELLSMILDVYSNEIIKILFNKDTGKLNFPQR